MAVAHGANTWYGIYQDNNTDARMNTVKAVNQFLEQNEEDLTGTRSAARVALLWSDSTANHYQSTSEETDFTRGEDRLTEWQQGDARGSFMGWYDALSRSRILFDVIDEASIGDGSFQRYDLVILPESSCMSEEEAGHLEAYVRRGGKLIASFDTAFYDEEGTRRPQPLLADVLGLKEVVGILPSRFDHMETEWGDPLLKGMDQSLIPAPSLSVRGKPSPGVHTVMRYRRKQESRYEELPDATDFPFILRNRHGAGEAIYLTGNVGKFYECYALPEYRTLMTNAVRELCEDWVIVETEAESLHLSLRKKKNRWMLHLINYTGSMTRPIGSVLPLRMLPIRLRIPGFQATRIWSSALQRTLPFQEANGEVITELPELSIYDILVVEHGSASGKCRRSLFHNTTRGKGRDAHHEKRNLPTSDTKRKTSVEIFETTSGKFPSANCQGAGCQ
ncbi:beta-galactosidase-like protein [Melghirimyces profundicolus]|uniref:Beta-galactosidase-like protein n=2 Tax=Melghirimyces profundicolus TaxID=1242148 RepID=A0A2T6C0J3_9BACL|nr:beta-galactosidase-like protein [Melghirimyces profundicolus]